MYVFCFLKYIFVFKDESEENVLFTRPDMQNSMFCLH